MLIDFNTLNIPLLGCSKNQFTLSKLWQPFDKLHNINLIFNPVKQS